MAALLLTGPVASGASAWLSTGASTPQGTGYDLAWWTVDGGGGVLGGGGYGLATTAGQPDAAPPLAGGIYTLYGGFWPGGAVRAGGRHIYLPFVLKH